MPVNANSTADHRSDDPKKLDERMAELYGALHQIASRQMAREHNRGVLQTTAIVHEAWFRLSENREVWNTRSEFLSAAAVTMKRVLIDHARKDKASKRGGEYKRMLLRDDCVSNFRDPIGLLELNEAIDQLAGYSTECAEIINQVVFSGMTLTEIASVMDMSKATVERRLQLARAWLRREIYGDES